MYIKTIQDYNFTCCFIQKRNLASLRGRKNTDGDVTWGAEEDIWALQGRKNMRMEKTPY
jgi:hypothetical protein